MVTSNTKGAYGETVIRDKLRALTGLQFERVPASGALDAKHGLKGDLYLVPVHTNKYCIEVKNYEEDHVTSKVITSITPQLLTFWSQAVRQGKQVDKKPLLLFKFNRSKIFAAYEDMPIGEYNYFFINANGYTFYVAQMEDWIKQDNPQFV